MLIKEHLLRNDCMVDCGDILFQLLLKAELLDFEPAYNLLVILNCISNVIYIWLINEKQLIEKHICG